MKQQAKDFIQSKGYVPNTLLSYDTVVELMANFALSLSGKEEEE